LKTSAVVKNIHIKLEKKVLVQADAVLTVSYRLANALEEVRGSKVEVLHNGYDEQDEVFTEHIKPEKFIVSHTGLLNEMRNPIYLWEAMEELCEENKDFEHSLDVRLGGIISESIISDIEEYKNLKNKISIVEYLPHDKIYEEYSKASILLLLLNNTNNSKWILPSKLFEYIHVGKPILMLGELESDASDIVQKFEGNFVVDFKNKDAIKNAILKNYQSYKEGQDYRNQCAHANDYSRRELTKQLVKVMNRITSIDN
jgi:glycosyltransferase involved in cell wall biosynthesis